MAERTPEPWGHYDDTGPDGQTGRHEIVALGRTIARIYGTKGREAEDAANAAFIVKAVNHHDALVAALRDMIPLAAAQVETLARSPSSHAELISEDRDDLRKARAVLAALEKVEGDAGG